MSGGSTGRILHRGASRGLACGVVRVGGWTTSRQGGRSPCLAPTRPLRTLSTPSSRELGRCSLQFASDLSSPSPAPLPLESRGVGGGRRRQRTRGMSALGRTLRPWLPPSRAHVGGRPWPPLMVRVPGLAGAALAAAEPPGERLRAVRCPSWVAYDAISLCT